MTKITKLVLEPKFLRWWWWWWWWRRRRQ